MIIWNRLWSSVRKLVVVLFGFSNRCGACRRMCTRGQKDCWLERLCRVRIYEGLAHPRIWVAQARILCIQYFFVWIVNFDLRIGRMRCGVVNCLVCFFLEVFEWGPQVSLLSRIILGYFTSEEVGIRDRWKLGETHFTFFFFLSDIYNSRFLWVDFNSIVIWTIMGSTIMPSVLLFPAGFWSVLILWMYELKIEQTRIHLNARTNGCIQFDRRDIQIHRILYVRRRRIMISKRPSQ